MSGDNDRLFASTTTERARFSRLLLVEDNSALRQTLTGILENEGFVVTGCATASEALQHVREKEFGVAVVDLRLPDMQGTQLLSKFRESGSKVRVIINTAYGAFESAKDAINLGAFAYIEKAGDPGDLVRQVQRAHRSHFERSRSGNDRTLGGIIGERETTAISFRERAGQLVARRFFRREASHR